MVAYPNGSLSGWQAHSAEIHVFTFFQYSVHEEQVVSLAETSGIRATGYLLRNRRRTGTRSRRHSRMGNLNCLHHVQLRRASTASLELVWARLVRYQLSTDTAQICATPGGLRVRGSPTVKLTAVDASDQMRFINHWGSP